MNLHIEVQPFMKIEFILKDYLLGLPDRKIRLSVPIDNQKNDSSGQRKILSVEKTVQFFRILSCCYKLILG
jgi:hypothetical protein